MVGLDAPREAQSPADFARRFLPLMVAARRQEYIAAVFSSLVEIDPHARRMAMEKFALPECLHLPIATRTEDAISRYVGCVVGVVAPGKPTKKPTKALVVQAVWIHEVDPALVIWELPRAKILRQSKQLWVHVDYRGYRSAYSKVFPEEDTSELVIDHVLNRRVARLKDFQYLRVVAISREANFSSGGLSEKWAVEYHSSPEMRAKNKASPAHIQMADISDIVKMLDIKTGGATQEPVNNAQSLLRCVSGPDQPR